jgi:hypothetical protein
MYMSANTDKCPFLNDRIVKGDAITPDCTCVDKKECPHIRSMKKAIGPQCWRIKTVLVEKILKKIGKK